MKVFKKRSIVKHGASPTLGSKLGKGGDGGVTSSELASVVSGVVGGVEAPGSKKSSGSKSKTNEILKNIRSADQDGGGGGGKEGKGKKDKKHKDKGKKAANSNASVADSSVGGGSSGGGGGGGAKARPSYRIQTEKDNTDNKDGASVAGSAVGMDGKGDDQSVMGDGVNVAIESVPSSATLGTNTSGPGGSKVPAAVSASAVKASHIASSAGTHRLNRILRNTNAEEMARNQTQGRFLSAIDDKAAQVKIERVSNPTKIPIVADFAAKVVLPALKVDPRSIGGTSFGEGGYPASMQQETLLCFKCKSFESTGTDVVAQSALEYPTEYAKHKRTLGLFSGIGAAKLRTKLRYVMIARSTNQPLLAKKKLVTETKENQEADGENEDSANNIGYDTMFSDMENENKYKDHGDNTSEYDDSVRESDLSIQNEQTGKQVDKNNANNDNEAKDNNNNNNSPTATEPAAGVVDDEDEEEVSSFPALVCMAFHNDGTSPDIRKLIQLDKLTTVQDLQGSLVQLVFANGDTVRLDFSDPDKSRHSLNQTGGATGGHGSGPAATPSNGLEDNDGDEVKGGGSTNLNKERFIWCLLQIHAMLCVSVVERTSLGTNYATTMKDGGLLPPLNVRNIDRAELQYLATVNRFVLQFDTIRILLNRQRQLADFVESRGPTSDATKTDNAGPTSVDTGGGPNDTGGALTATNNTNKYNDEKTVALEEMDTMAYDLMMGNFATRVAIFQNDSERKDAEEILNSTEWTESLKLGKNNKVSANCEHQDTAAATAAERLAHVLQKRMRDLEAETCRRLIAWEDEKHYSAIGQKSPSHTTVTDSVDALSLASLFTTLDSLDTELQKMENWLQERAAAIKPMTDDCQDIEEENRQLEQQWKSYDMLGAEMRRILKGLEVGEKVEKVLNNPASALAYNSDGSIDVVESEHGVDQIHTAGKKLQEAMKHVHRCGGLHLKAVRERSDALDQTTNAFCTALAQIIVTVMEQFKTEVVAGSDHGKVSKSDTHTMIMKKIRDTQRKFQSALLQYIKLIEILAELSPELLPAVRDAYSEMVAEGIMMKKRMKGYFQALPGKNASYLNDVSKDLRDYTPFEIVKEDTVHAEDIRYALSELLPVIAREAYFTAALFGLSSKAQDGREKKRNFEAAKKSADHSSQYFNYYIQRTCGIIQDFDPDPGANKNYAGQNHNTGDPMLCLIASIHLNEAMANYIDREKKGGDHSLSLAYVRATILELRKKVDKQWVAWVDRQIEWIRSNHGVPANGKRAGIIPSFARFPCYLDHILLCCREGRKEDYTPDFANIKVVSYYLQKMATALLESLRECCERETTDQQYASNVMSMENTYYFTQCIKHRGNEMSILFKKQITKANTTCKQSTDAYLGWMIKREFTSLHELFSKISKARRDVGDKSVISHIPKATFVRTLVKESSRDVLKEKISILHHRMSKHLSEQGGLLPVAWKALVKVLYEWFGRWEKLAHQCYAHKLEPSAVDVVRIAKAAGSSYNSHNNKDKDPVAAPPVLPGGGTGITAGVPGLGKSAIPGLDHSSHNKRAGNPLVAAAAMDHPNQNSMLHHSTLGGGPGSLGHRGSMDGGLGGGLGKRGSMDGGLGAGLGKRGSMDGGLGAGLGKRGSLDGTGLGKRGSMDGTGLGKRGSMDGAGGGLGGGLGHRSTLDSKFMHMSIQE